VKEEGIYSVLEPAAQRLHREVEGDLHGAEKVLRLDAILKRMAHQGQLGGRKVHRSFAPPLPPFACFLAGSPTRSLMHKTDTEQNRTALRRNLHRMTPTACS
jgi:hypothetical protein